MGMAISLLPRLECFWFFRNISLQLFTELKTCEIKHIYCNIHIFVFLELCCFPICFYLVVGGNQPLSKSAELGFAARTCAIASRLVEFL